MSSQSSRGHLDAIHSTTGFLLLLEGLTPRERETLRPVGLEPSPLRRRGRRRCWCYKVGGEGGRERGGRREGWGERERGVGAAN